VAAFLALVAGFVVGSSSGGGGTKSTTSAVKPPPKALATAEKLSLRRQIGQTLIVAFPGTTVPAYMKKALRRGKAAGVILFQGNATTPAVTLALTRSLQRAGHHTLLIATDQEGGPIRTLSWAAPTIPEGSTPTPFVAAKQAKAAAQALFANGLNVNLAPVADVGGPSSVMKGRAFPGGTSDVRALVSSSVRAYKGTSVAATLKHFPGLGEASENTDNQPVTISSPRPALMTRDVPPFTAGIKAGAQLVMASHALYKGLDRTNIASQSKPILTTLLRRKLGFKGVVITDSMEAAAVLKRSSLETAALRSMSAGADLLLLTGAGSFPRVYDELVIAAKRSPKFRARIAEAAARVIALKRALGLRTG
jgi:beta-N-acetylhexosaminidase